MTLAGGPRSWRERNGSVQPHIMAALFGTTALFGAALKEEGWAHGRGRINRQAVRPSSPLWSLWRAS